MMIGLSVYALRKAMEPEWNAHRMRRMSADRERRRKARAALPPEPPKPRTRTVYERSDYRHVHTEHVGHTIVPHDVLLDRERRLALAPRPLSAALCGDPLPGYSAGDRRR